MEESIEKCTSFRVIDAVVDAIKSSGDGEYCKKCGTLIGRHYNCEKTNLYPTNKKLKKDSDNVLYSTLKKFKKYYGNGKEFDIDGQTFYRFKENKGHDVDYLTRYERKFVEYLENYIKEID